MFSTTRLMLFFDGRYPRYAFPVFVEYINPKEYPRKSNSPSGTLQMRVLSSLTVSFSFPMISRSRDAVCSFGDVIFEGRDLYGDGVNIAARLEGLAEPTHAPQQTTGYSIISSVASVLGLIQATPLSEGPQSTAS